MDCVFCKIIDKMMVNTGDEPSIVYSDDFVVAFRAREPVAPVHVLIVPRKHIASLYEIAHVAGGDGRDHQANVVAADIGHALVVASAVARKFELTNGYRVVVNTGEDAGQTVKHFHLHLLGGRKLGDLG